MDYALYVLRCVPEALLECQPLARLADALARSGTLCGLLAASRLPSARRNVVAISLGVLALGSAISEHGGGLFRCATPDAIAVQ